MVRIVIFGQGLVATHFAIGLERLKNGEIPGHGVPSNIRAIRGSMDSVDSLSSFKLM